MLVSNKAVVVVTGGTVQSVPQRARCARSQMVDCVAKPWARGNPGVLGTRLQLQLVPVTGGCDGAGKVRSEILGEGYSTGRQTPQAAVEKYLLW